MREDGLSGAVGILRRFCTKSEEKVPFAYGSSQKTDGGAISQLSASLPSSDSYQIDDKLFKEMQNSKLSENKDSTSEEKETGPMSTLRKLCFFLSINVCILYLSIFFWLIPCKQSCSSNHEWQITLDNIQLTTNLEVLSTPEHNLVLVGYIDRTTVSVEKEGNIAALNVKNGVFIWNSTLNFSPIHIQCSFSFSLKVAATNRSCLISGRTEISAIDVSDGQIIWKQTFGTNDVVHPLFSLIHCPNGQRIVFSRTHLFESSKFEESGSGSGVVIGVLDANSGRRILSLPAPCDNLPLQLESWELGKEIKAGVVVTCQLDSSTDLWLIPSSILCSTGEKEEMFLDKKFNHLYGLNESAYSYVIRSSAGLVVANSKTVSLLSDTKPHQELWKGVYTGNIMDIVQGYFTSHVVSQLAVGIRDEDSDKVLVLNELNGKKVTTENLTGGYLVSMKAILDNKEKGKPKHSILLELDTSNHSSSVNVEKGRQVRILSNTATSSRTYKVLKFDEGKPVTSTIISDSISGIAISDGNEDGAFFIMAKNGANQTATIKGYLLLNENCQN